MGDTDRREPWPRDEVHLWVATCDQSGIVDSMLASLAPNERERAGRFRFIADRDRFIVRHGIVRHILAGYLGIDPGGLDLGSGTHGKPRLSMTRGPFPLRFNQSHSGGRTLVAVAERREIGVDCEAVRKIAEAEAIVNDFASDAERASYDRIPRDERPAAFAIWWTRKEAFVKAIGTGLTCPLRCFDVSSERVRVVRSEHERDTRWSLMTLASVPGYIVSLCIEGSSVPVRCRDARESVGLSRMTREGYRDAVSLRTDADSRLP